jgi:phosphoenolpyruvate carboxylase
MITQNYGSTSIAERTLDIYTAAVLAEKFVKHVEPKLEWRQEMDRLSNVSCESYRSLIVNEKFVKYFRQATPELELGFFLFYYYYYFLFFIFAYAYL